MIYKKTKKDIKEAALSKAIRKDKSSKENRRPIHFSDSESKEKNKFRFQEECTYVPDFMHDDLEEANSLLTLEDYPDESYFSSETLFEVLINELTMQISGEIKNEKKFTAIRNRIHLLKKTQDHFIGRELLALHFCISTYASECYSNERKKEIRRTMFLLQEELKTHEVEMEKLQKKVDELDKEELFELTDILINSKDIRFCVWDFKSLLRCF